MTETAMLVRSFKGLDTPAIVPCYNEEVAVGKVVSQLLALILGVPLPVPFVQTNEVPRLPTAVLATGLVLVGILSVVVGLVVNSILRLRQETARLSYLRLPPVSRPSMAVTR